METTAQAKYIRMSPKKVRLVADLIRGLDVKAAVTQLQFSKKDAALPLLKLIKSAVSNGAENDKLKEDNLYIKEIRVDAGSVLKRWMPRALGRATPIRKRSASISVVLSEKVPTIVKEGERAKKKDQKDDIINIEDLGSLKSESKSESKKTVKEERAGKGSKKGFAKNIFNRTGNK